MCTKLPQISLTHKKDTTASALKKKKKNGPGTRKESTFFSSFFSSCEPLRGNLTDKETNPSVHHGSEFDTIAAFIPACRSPLCSSDGDIFA